MAQLRIGLTISGAISLGAYEGGALAGLIVVLRELAEDEPDNRIVVDAIIGASAGSMTGVLAARALLTEADPVKLMHEAWVAVPSLANLRGGGHDSPLSVDAVAEVAKRLLGDDAPTDGAPAQTEAIHLELALGALRGLSYRFKRGAGPVRDAPPVLDAITYLDWEPATLTAQDPPAAYLAMVEAALASGAHAAAFRSRVLDRSAVTDAYTKAGVTNFPDTKQLWYTDGGTIDNQPLGRALDITGGIDAHVPDARRLHLLVIPDPSFAIPSDSTMWADPHAQPLWVSTLGRAGKMAFTQSLYDDFRQAEKTNSRLRWRDGLVDTLAAELDPSARSALAAYINGIEGERSELGARLTPKEPVTGEEELRDLIARAIASATGLSGKQAIEIEAISPQLLGAEDAAAVKALLAGEFLGHFGGFLEERLRRSDFHVGYRSALAWVTHPQRGLAAYGIAPARIAPAVAAAKEKLVNVAGAEQPAGDMTLGRLGPHAWWRLVGVAVRTYRVVRYDIRHRSRG